VSFFNRLWEKIKSVIASVADKLLDVAKKGMQRESDEIEKSRRQNWETRPAGEERDDVEMEPAMRQRKLEIQQAELALEAYSMQFQAFMRQSPSEQEVAERLKELEQPIRQLRLMQLRVVVRQMRKEGAPLEGEMKRVAIDVEIEELRDRLMKGKSEMEEMLARGEEPEKIQKVVEYLERIMVALERRTDELRALGDDTEEPAEE